MSSINNNEKKARCAIIPGSFDPMTLGHLSVVAKAAEMFDSVTVAILNNPDKKCTFSLSERKEIAKRTCAGLSNVNVITADGLLVDIARAIGAKYIIKGVRSTVDFEYEQNMAKINKELAPELQTIYIPSDSELEIVSSSLVRQLLKNGKNIAAYIHSDVIELLRK